MWLGMEKPVHRLRPVVQWLLKGKTQMTLHSQIVGSEKFDFKGGVFVAEISDLGHFNFARLYDDACDAGLTLRSAKTGKLADFYVAKVNDDGDGELIGWTLKPTNEAISRNPGLKGVEMEIFND
jgi:hypothetical protein